MLPLYEKSTRYLVRGGYRIEDAAPGFAIAQFAGEDIRDRPDRVLLWVGDDALPASRTLDEAGRQLRTEREDILLRQIISEMQADMDAVGVFVVPSRQGLSTEFITAATDSLQRAGRDRRGGVRIPSEFFDTDFKMDTRTGRAAKASALGRVFDRVKRRQRVAQPFVRVTALGPGNRKPIDGDIVEHLDLLFRDPVTRPTLRIIDGPAGSGKSVAFETLVVALYEEFVEAKKRQLERPRPVVFLPEHIRGEALSGYVDNVIDAAMDAESARPVEADQLRFLLNQGHAMWLFDGLDEFFGNDNNFFDYLGNELANPESRAQLLICSRDSLLTSSTALRSFVETQLIKGSAIEIYELAPWGPDAWRKIAWMEMESGIAGRETSPRVNAFVDALTASPELTQLASLPFYCVVLFDEFRKSSSLPADPLSVLDTVVDRMLEREADKKIFAWREFVDLERLSELDEVDATSGRPDTDVIEQVLDKAGSDNVREMLGQVAHFRVRGAAQSGVDVAELRDTIAPAYIDPSLEGNESDRLLTSVVQFAFFGAGKKAGVVDFSHPILAEHLAAGYALGLLRKASNRIGRSGEGAASVSALSRTQAVKGAIRQALGSAKLDHGSVFFRALSRGIRAEDALAHLLDTALGLATKNERKLSVDIQALLGDRIAGGRRVGS